MEPVPQVAGGQGVQVGSGNEQLNVFIQNYIASMPPAAQPVAARVVVAGEVPRQPPAFQPRPELMAGLEASGPGVVVVRALTGMRGAGKTQLAEAVAFLGRRTGRGDAAGAAELARELGGLPLALSQAAAVIAARGLDYPTYLKRLRAVPAVDYLRPAEAEPYPQGAAEAISLALDSVAQGDATGLCGGLADVLALLSPAGVPRTLLQACGQAGVLTGAGGAAADAEAVDTALGRLARASLVTFSTDGSAVSTHRLIMRVARDRLASAGRLTRLGAALADLLDTVLESLAQPWQARAATRDVVGQVMALHGHLAPGLDADVALATRLVYLRSRAVWCLNELGDSFASVIEYSLPLVADAERILGDAHSGTLTARSNLAATYLDAGRLAEAVALHERTLADREQSLGDTHPDTLTSRNNLAVTYLGAGRVAEAVALQERTLADRERVLGDTHPDTLSSRHNLAVAYQDAGRLDEAISLYERTLAEVEQALGAAHPHALTVRRNLAAAYTDAGRAEDAQRLLPPGQAGG